MFHYNFKFKLQKQFQNFYLKFFDERKIKENEKQEIDDRYIIHMFM